MNISKKVSNGNSRVELLISGKLSVDDRLPFKKSYEEALTDGVEVIVDLNELTELCFSALGLILSLKDHVDSFNGTLSIIPPQDAKAFKMLKLARIDNVIKVAEYQ